MNEGESTFDCFKRIILHGENNGDGYIKALFFSLDTMDYVYALNLLRRCKATLASEIRSEIIASATIA